MNWAAGASVFSAAGLALFAVWSILLSLIDIRERRLPNRLLLLASGTTIPVLLASTVAHGLDHGNATVIVSDRSAESMTWDTVLVAAAFGALFAALWRWSPQGIGGGDVKLGPLVGAAIGFTGGWAAAALTVIGAFGAAAIWSAVRETGRRRGARETVATVPFAPCLFAAAWIMIAWF